MCPRIGRAAERSTTCDGGAELGSPAKVFPDLAGCRTPRSEPLPHGERLGAPLPSGQGNTVCRLCLDGHPWKYGSKPPIRPPGAVWGGFRRQRLDDRAVTLKGWAGGCLELRERRAFLNRAIEVTHRVLQAASSTPPWAVGCEVAGLPLFPPEVARPVAFPPISPECRLRTGTHGGSTHASGRLRSPGQLVRIGSVVALLPPAPRAARSPRCASPPRDRRPPATTLSIVCVQAKRQHGEGPHLDHVKSLTAERGTAQPSREHRPDPRKSA